MTNEQRRDIQASLLEAQAHLSTALTKIDALYPEQDKALIDREVGLYFGVVNAAISVLETLIELD